MRDVRVSWRLARVPWLLSAVAKLLLVVGLERLSGRGDVTLAGLAGLLAFPLLVASYGASLVHREQDGRVAIGGGAIDVTHGAMREMVPMTDVTSALVVERRSRWSVEIERRNGDVLVLRTADEPAAREIADALGFGEGGRRLRAGLARPARRLLHLLLAAAAFLAAIGPALSLASVVYGPWMDAPTFVFLPSIALFLHELAKWLTRPARVTVGDDGVVVHRAYGDTMLARRDLRVDREGERIVLRSKDGRPVELGGVTMDDARVAALGRAIEARSPPEAVSPDRFSHYGRDAMPVAAWRGRLEELAKQTDYRSAASGTEETLSVLGSARATPEQRIGAAVAARAMGVPPERIRVAAEATADDRVRVALEAVASDADDAALERAVRRFSR